IGSAGVSVLLGNGNGTFQTAQTFGPNTATGLGETIAVADFNGDGRPDLVVGSGNAVVLLGNGDGTFQAGSRFKTDTHALSVAAAAADVNGDGRPDIVTANDGFFPNNGTVSVLLNTLAPPNPTFLSPATTTFSLGTPGSFLVRAAGLPSPT